MKLAGIDCQIPSQQIFNEDIIDLVAHYSAGLYHDDLPELKALIRKFLELSGIESRFWRSTQDKPIDLIQTSVENALRMANLTKHNIDLVIYSSIDRGFMEPANASFICKAIGLKNVRNFDVVDACMGWASAVQIAHSFLISSPSIHNILIINAEFPMDKNGSVLPENFSICNKEELKWKAASFTLGEAASACIFQKDASADCKFEFLECSEHADLCAIPLKNYDKYITGQDQNCSFPIMNFYAHSTSLLQKGLHPAVAVLQTLLNRLNYDPAIVFPHSVSGRFIKDAAMQAQVEPLIYSTFSRLGNLATASVPSSLHHALTNNRINKDEKGIVWIASAGMKFSAFEIQL